MCSCYTKIKKTVKFVCFWVIILAAIDAGVSATGCQFLSSILTPNAEIVVKILAAISAMLVLLFVTFGRCGCGGKCKCGCDYGCDCGCTCNDCKCEDNCACNTKKDEKSTEKQDKKIDLTNKK